VYLEDLNAEAKLPPLPELSVSPAPPPPGETLPGAAPATEPPTE